MSWNQITAVIVGIVTTIAVVWLVTMTIINYERKLSDLRRERQMRATAEELIVIQSRMLIDYKFGRIPSREDETLSEYLNKTLKKLGSR